MRSSGDKVKQSNKQKIIWLNKIKSQVIHLSIIGFSMLLISIINEVNSSDPLKPTASMQLKNTIKRYWKTETFEIQAAEK